MPTVTVTAKGQVTLRKELLQYLGVQPGEKILVDKLPDGQIAMKAAWPTGEVSDLFDMFKRKSGPRLSIEQIDEITRRGWPVADEHYC
jgi:bifunctional DNA-binding transcriptional regulator/antitoxin component of YhaV-PrlF toxin-antitoxin module